MKRSSRSTLLAAAAAVAPWLAPGTASAQMAHIPDNDWRQPDRHDAITAGAAKASFAFEVRLGTYLPADIDSGDSFGGKRETLLPASAGAKGAPTTSRTPFKDTFGFNCTTGHVDPVSPRLAFGLELDALPVRIPYLGMFGVGVGWSYTSFGNYAKLTVLPGAATPSVLCGAQTTTLTVMPMHASLVLRVDELMRRTGIPIVPYGKAGGGFSYWRASTESGTETYAPCGTVGTPTQCNLGEKPAATAPTPINGIGLSPSLHFALGGMIALNFIDPRASARLDETTGIHHAYIFGEWYSDSIPLASKILRVGASSWVAGLAVDL